MRISDWSSDVCSSDLEAVIDAGGFSAELFGKDAADVLADVEGVQILACGTSFYSGSVARYWIEAITGLPCNVEIASEYRYRSAVANPKHLVVTISQSGETLDTMEALKYAKSLGHDKTLSICNVPESAIPRASRSQEHTSELQSLMRISYAVFCLKKKKQSNMHHPKTKFKEDDKKYT